MIGPEGNVQMLGRMPESTAELNALRDQVKQAAPGSVLAFGAEDDIYAMAAKVKLGAAEQEARRARRRQQRESRRRNR